MGIRPAHGAAALLLVSTALVRWFFWELDAPPALFPVPTISAPISSTGMLDLSAAHRLPVAAPPPTGTAALPTAPAAAAPTPEPRAPAPLPPPPPPAAPAAIPPCGDFPGGTAADLHARLRRLQAPARCEEQRLLVFRMPHEGMFATLDQVVVALQYALCHGRTLVVDAGREWMYAPRANCSVNGVYEPWACWFQALSPCKAPTELPRTDNTYCHKVRQRDRVLTMTAEWEAVRAKQSVPCFGQYYPVRFLHKAALTAFLLRPSARVERAVAQLMVGLEAQGLRRPFIALHMRATDKCKPWRKDPGDRHCYTYRDHYRPLLLRAADAVGTRHVLLVTDNATLRRVLPATETALRLYTVPQTPGAQPPAMGAVPFLKQRVKEGKAILPSSGFDVAAHSESFVAELCLMARAEWFVGTYSSNVGRRVIELMGVQRQTGDWTSYSSSVDVSERMWDSKYKS